jgi:hypothetical protein
MTWPKKIQLGHFISYSLLCQPLISLNQLGHLVPHLQENAAKLMDKLVVPIEVDLNK